MRTSTSKVCRLPNICNNDVLMLILRVGALLVQQMSLSVDEFAKSFFTYADSTPDVNCR